MTLPLLSPDATTLAIWATVFAFLAYPLGGALFDAWREWRWNREQRRTMETFETGRAALRRRGRA